MDVDVVVDLRTRSKFNEPEATLRNAGFRQPVEGPICRWLIRGVQVDIMPAEESILGFTNRWYGELLGASCIEELAPGLRIRVVSAPYLLATKLEAFLNRGAGDYRMSHDLTDVLAVVNGRDEVQNEVRDAPPHLRAFIAENLAALLAEEEFVLAIAGHLPPDEISQERARMIQGRLEALVQLDQT